MTETKANKLEPTITGPTLEPSTVSPFQELWIVAWPTVLTMTSYTVMHFVDGLMVSAVGPEEFAAQGNGGICAFLPISFAMGLLSVVNTFVSQNLGADTPERGPQYAWGALWLSLAVWIVLIPYAFLQPILFKVTGHEPGFIQMEADYARVLILGSVLVMGTRSLSHFFYGMHRSKIVFVSTLCGNITNVFANWVLIFGHFGAPEYGLMGAAYGTIIGTAVEFIIPLAIFLGPKLNAELHTRSQWRLKWVCIKDLARIGWPKSVQFGNEMICWSIFMVILIGKFGEAHMTAGWITLKYMHLSFMPSVGISVAVTAVVGKHIGAGDPDIASQRAWLGVKMAMTYMGLCAIGFVLFRHQLVEFFLWLNKDSTPEAQAIAEQVRVIGARLLICAAVFQLFDALAITMSGALSGAGDTVWPGIVTIACSWIFIVGLGVTLSYAWPSLESLGPWIGAAVYIIVIGLLMYWRWQSDHWRSINLLRNDPEE